MHGMSSGVTKRRPGCVLPRAQEQEINDGQWCRRGRKGRIGFCMLLWEFTNVLKTRGSYFSKTAAQLY